MRRFSFYFWLPVLVFGLAVPALGDQMLIFKPVVSIYTDGEGIGLLRPEDVACSAEDIIIADTGNNRLVKYVIQDNEVKFIAEFRFPQLQSPTRVQLTSRGEIWALNSKSRSLVRIAADGSFAGYLDPKGVPDQENVIIRSFRLDRDNNVYILDTFGNRILALDAGGTFQRQVDLPGGTTSFGDFVVADNGTIYAVDSIHAQIHSADRDADTFSPLSQKLKDRMRFPTYITTDNSNNLYVTDQNGGKIIVLGIDGSFLGQKASQGWSEGLFNYPVGLCLNGSGLAFVADRNNNRVQIFR